MILRLLPALALVGCVAIPMDSGFRVPHDTQPPDPVQATLVLLSATTGSGVADLQVDFADQTVSTASDGKAEGEVASGAPFELPVRGDDYVDHLIFGPAGDNDFSVITYVATESITTQVLNMLGLSWAPGTGFVVVGVDYTDLSPVEGATVSLGASHGQPFVFASGYPSPGSVIPPGGMGFVSFPSVEAGTTSVTVQPPGGVSCGAHPSGGEMPAVPVLADTVTVVTYRCQ